MDPDSILLSSWLDDLAAFGDAPLRATAAGSQETAWPERSSWEVFPLNGLDQTWSDLHRSHESVVCDLAQKSDLSCLQPPLVWDQASVFGPQHGHDYAQPLMNHCVLPVDSNTWPNQDGVPNDSGVSALVLDNSLFMPNLNYNQEGGDLEGVTARYSYSEP
jgi:hypothetical protein